MKLYNSIKDKKSDLELVGKKFSLPDGRIMTVEHWHGDLQAYNVRDNKGNLFTVDAAIVLSSTK